MKDLTRIVSWSLVCLAAVGFTAAPQASAADTCCFTNPRYSGTCEVEPGPDETCGDILEYLNTQTSVGKAYCENTTVRGGWAQATCQSGDQSSVTVTHPDPQTDSAD